MFVKRVIYSTVVVCRIKLYFLVVQFCILSNWTGYSVAIINMLHTYEGCFQHFVFGYYFWWILFCVLVLSMLPVYFLINATCRLKYHTILCVHKVVLNCQIYIQGLMNTLLSCNEIIPIIEVEWSAQCCCSFSIMFIIFSCIYFLMVGY